MASGKGWEGCEMWLSWSKHNLVFNKQYMLGLVCDGIGLLSNIYAIRIRYTLFLFIFPYGYRLSSEQLLFYVGFAVF